MVRGFQGKLANGDWQQWNVDMRETEAHLREIDSVTPTGIQHYVEFRNRFHFGHMPKARPLYTPLNSKYTRRVMAAMPGKRRRRFYFDVMESLCPGLKDFRYDRDDKAPDPTDTAGLTFARSLGSSKPGRVYASPAMPAPQSQVRSGRGFDLWLADVQRAADNHLVQSFFGGKAMSRANKAISEAVDGGGHYQSHSAEAVLLSSLISVDFAFG